MFYEPKWDGFRCIVFWDGDDVELGSRNEKPLTRYFPAADRAASAAGMRARTWPGNRYARAGLRGVLRPSAG
jgi:ATP-dependent DNA ligase